MNLVNEFLNKIGVSSETISKITAEEPDSELNLDDLAKGFVSNQKSLSANDPELIKKIRDEIRGTELSKIEHKLKKQFNLSTEDVRDKKFEEILEDASKKIRLEAGSTSEELQSKILELNNSIKKYEEEILPETKAQAQNEIKRFRRDLAIRDVLSKKNLIVGTEVVLPALNTHLNEFIVDLDESDKLTIKTKDGLKPLNADGTKSLSLEEIIDGQLNSMNVIKQSNASDDPGKPTTTTTTQTTNAETPKFKLRGLDKAVQNAGNLAEMRRHGLPK